MIIKEEKISHLYEVENIINDISVVEVPARVNISEDSVCLKRRRGSFSYHDTMASLNHSNTEDNETASDEFNNLPLLFASKFEEENSMITPEKGIFVTDGDEDELSRIFPINSNSGVIGSKTSIKDPKKIMSQPKSIIYNSID